MTDTDRMLVWLRETLDAAQHDAEAAGGDEWRRQEHPSDTVAVYDSKGEPVVYDEGAPTEAQQAHISRHDPDAVLRRIAADRQILDDLIAEQHNVVEDPAYTCPAATSERDGGRNYHPGAWNCGRDERVQRRVRLLAEGYGWTEEEGHD